MFKKMHSAALEGGKAFLTPALFKIKKKHTIIKCFVFLACPSALAMPHMRCFRTKSRKQEKQGEQGDGEQWRELELKSDQEEVYEDEETKRRVERGQRGSVAIAVALRSCFLTEIARGRVISFFTLGVGKYVIREFGLLANWAMAPSDQRLCKVFRIHCTACHWSSVARFWQLLFSSRRCCFLTKIVLAFCPRPYLANCKGDFS
jgi:hypothetical protein